MSERGQERFPPKVRKELERWGWHPGRNVRGEVDTWLARLYEKEPGLRDRPVVVAAARRILDEFGGLVFDRYGRGEDVAVSPFRFHPSAARTYPLGFPVFEELLRGPVFPVGLVEDEFDLLVDERGRVFLEADADLYVGAGIDEALIALILGRTLRPAFEVAPPDQPG